MSPELRFMNDMGDLLISLAMVKLVWSVFNIHLGHQDTQDRHNYNVY